MRDLSIDVPGPAGDITLVCGISFDLVAGRTLAIVGESGCGKSVTARALLGIAPPGGRIAGSIRFDGAELAGAREAEWRGIRGRRIAFIGQEPMSGLDPAQTDRLGAHRGRSAPTPAAGASRPGSAPSPCSAGSGSTIRSGWRGLYPHQVSGGMAQRVTIARALAGDPEILVADEPTTALDVTIQADILALLRSLQQTSEIAVLLVTHDWGVVAGLADDVLVMYAGQAVEQAAAEVVFDRPRHPYTEALLGSDPHGATPGMPLPAIAGTVPAPGRWPSGCRFADRCRYVTPECTVAEPSPGQTPRRGTGPDAFTPTGWRGRDDQQKQAAATATATAGAGALLEVQDLCVSYRHGGRTFSALDKVSVDVQAGQTVAVVGESGAGKSTLGRAVLGLVPVTSGVIRFDGQDITRLGHRARVADRGSAASGVPGSEQLAEPGPHHRLVGRRAAAWPAQTARRGRGTRSPPCSSGSGCRPARPTATRGSSPAASASGSRSPGR